MRKIREILRLKHSGRSQREIAGAVRASVGTVCEQLKRAKACGLTWQQAQQLSDAELEALLFRDASRSVCTERSEIDFKHLHHELHRSGVTLQLLWEEYQAGALTRAIGTKPYQYSHFCELYRAWRARLKPSMRRVHVAGERAFIDYSGKKLRLTDRMTGEAREVELFVMVLGASNYTFAEASQTQTLPDFVSSTIRGFEHFGGVPEAIVPDQLRSAVRGPDRYEPDINPTYLEMAQHYNVAVLPARPRRPKDKAKVETGVLIVQRWILARLRNRTFFELGELNHAVAELLEELNHRPFKKLQGTRESAFIELEKAVMRPLPAVRYELAERRVARVNIDYHVEYSGRYYSVPYTLVHAQVEVRATSAMVEVFAAVLPRSHGSQYAPGDRVATHARCYGRRGMAVTDALHRPAHHEEQVWPPERILGWASKFGPAVETVVAQMLGRYVIPEQGYRACLGLLRLAERVGAEKMNAACASALRVGMPGGPPRKYIEAILKRGLENESSTMNAARRTPLIHENVRGGDYYNTEETMN
jgi:transposase